MAHDWFSWVKDKRLRAAADYVLNGGTFDQDDAMLAIKMLCNESAEHIAQKVGKEFFAQYYPTDRHGGLWNLNFPVGVVDHYTAGISPRGTLKWFSSKPRGPGIGNSSAHVVLDRDGILYVVVNPLKYIAWHAPGANSTSIGIEHVNAGLLLRKTSGEYRYLGTRKYPEDRVTQLQKIGVERWEPYTTAQLVANIVFKRWLIQALPGMKKDRFVDHQEIDPNRKKDCGPLWPLRELNALVFSMEAVRDMVWMREEFLTDVEGFKKEVRQKLSA